MAGRNIRLKNVQAKCVFSIFFVIYSSCTRILNGKIFLKAVSRKFTLLRGVNFKICPDFGPNICKQTGQKSKSNCKHINILRNLKIF